MQYASIGFVLAGLVLSVSANAGEGLSPSERALTLAMAVNQDEAPEAGAESAPSLTQSIFGFDEEIETDHPETQAGIEKARRKSGVKAPAAKKADNSSTTEAL